MLPVSALVLSLMTGCEGAVDDGADDDDNVVVDPYACEANAGCPDVEAGTSALRFSTSRQEAGTLIAGDASLYSFHGDTISLTPLLWGSAENEALTIVTSVTGHASGDETGQELELERADYVPGAGGLFEAPTIDVVASSDLEYLTVTTETQDSDGNVIGLLDANLRIDLFHPQWAGDSNAEIVIPLHVWRVRSSDDQYGAEISEAELANFFNGSHTDPALPMTVNEIFAPLNIRFEATVETLVVPEEWDYMARRVPCDEDSGTCYRTRRAEFAETYGDPNAMNVFVVYYIAGDDLPPSDEDNIEDSTFGLTFLFTYSQQPTSAARPGVWLSSKIWLSERDSRSWPSRIIAHELGHAFNQSHHQSITARLLMTPTWQADPNDQVAGSAILNLPNDDQSWTEIRERSQEFVDNLGSVQ